MIIIEYRIPMPFSSEEYRIGQLYTIAKKSKIESVDTKSGVRINANEPYTSGPGGSGQYTNKTYYLANKIPDWLKRILPNSAAKLKEEAWNAYPYSKNKFTNSSFEKLQLEIESYYFDGPPVRENVFNLTKKDEASKSIVIIDLTLNSGEEVLLNDVFVMPKRMMTCYKLCRVSFPVWPIQTKVEQFIQQYCRETITESHRQTLLWQNEWTGMGIDQIREMERETQRDLVSMMQMPESLN